MMTITCPHCGRVGSLKAAVPIGSRVRCPGCQEKFEVQDDSRDAPDVIDLEEPDDFGAGVVGTPPDQGIDLTNLQPATAIPSGGPSGFTSSSSAPSPGPIPGPPNQPASIFVPAPDRPRPTFWNGQTSTGPSIVMGILATILFAAAVAVWMGPTSRFDPDGYSLRFQRDNAYGATANALEYLARRQDTSRPEVWFLAGLVCILIGSVEKLRRAVLVAAGLRS